MSAIAFGGIVFACVFGGALLGMFLRAALPTHHLSEASRDIVKLGTGLIATLAALVLSLLISSAHSRFDTRNHELKQTAADLILLDRVLARYGPETKEARDLLRRLVANKLALTWPEESQQPTTWDSPGTVVGIERVSRQLEELSPRDDAQRELKSRALQIAGSLEETRWLAFEQEVGSSIPILLLVILVFWLATIFASFGLFAPPNATVVAVLLLCALSASGAIFMILELNSPLAGLIKLSSAPLRDALARLGQ